MIFLDLETRSFAKLDKVGAYVYAEHETTQVSCASYMFDDDMKVRTWAPWRGRDHLFRSQVTTRDEVQAIMVCPTALRERIEAGELIAAHNAFFERCMFELHLGPFHDWPTPKPEQWVCTMAAAHYSGFPGKLADCAKFLSIQQQIGKKTAIKKLMKPRPTWVNRGTGDPWFGTADEYEQLVSECCDDVRAEYEVYQRCEPLSPRERRIWLLDQEINWRGVPIDRALAEGAVRIINNENKKAIAELAELTHGEVTTPKQRDRILAWLERRGTKVPDLRAPTVDDLLSGALPPDVQRVLEIRKALGGAATNKYAAFMAHCASDGRVHGELIYHGAHTGRWTSKGVQLQNTSKNQMDVEVAEALIPWVTVGDIEKIKSERYTPDDVLSTLVRSVVHPKPDKVLVALDYSAVEARGLSWLGDEKILLDQFQSDIEPYIQIASRIYGVPHDQITKSQRALGKVAILGLGYGMGLEKFQVTVASWGLNVEAAVIEKAFRLYRGTYKQIVSFWYDLDRLIQSVILTGKAQQWKRLQVSYSKETKLLTIHLPSSRPLYYRGCEIEDGSIRYWGKEQGKWVRVYSWGGKFTENIVQGFCRDLMALAMVEMRARGINVILTVHDEILTEVAREIADQVKAIMEQIMVTPPAWAEGMPIAVSGYISDRARKD